VFTSLYHKHETQQDSPYAKHKIHSNSNSSSSSNSAYTSTTASFRDSFSSNSGRENDDTNSSTSSSSSSSSSYTSVNSNVAATRRDAKARNYCYTDSDDTANDSNRHSINESFASLQVSIVLLYCYTCFNTCIHHGFHNETFHSARCSICVYTAVSCTSKHVKHSYCSKCVLTLLMLHCVLHCCTPIALPQQGQTPVQQQRSANPHDSISQHMRTGSSNKSFTPPSIYDQSRASQYTSTSSSRIQSPFAVDLDLSPIRGTGRQSDASSIAMSPHFGRHAQNGGYNSNTKQHVGRMNSNNTMNNTSASNNTAELSADG
jgi:hypothetical protein